MFERVDWWVPARRATESIEQVNNGFGGRTEVGRTFRPSHGKAHWEGDERGFARGRGEGDAQGGDAGGVDPDPVETIAEVNLQEVDGPVRGVGVVDGLDQTLERVTKLERVRWGKLDGLGVHPREGVVSNGAGTAVTLGDTAHGGDAEVDEVLDQGKGQDDPVPFVHHIRHLGLEEGEIGSRGGMGTAGDGGQATGGGPTGGGATDRGARVSKTVQHGGGDVGEGAYVRVEAGRVAGGGNEGGPRGRGKVRSGKLLN
jgi:hypothetical protein